MFGFKSKIVRDLKYPGMIMEIFKATEIVPEYSPLVRKRREFKKESSTMMVWGGNIVEEWNRKDREREMVEKKPVCKELKAVQPEKFDTDESMRDIDYDDVKSDWSDQFEVEEVEKD